MRYLQLDVFDFSNHLLCTLYNSQTDISGQAYNVHKKTERNGWKEISFSIPSVCEGENGPEENYRLQYLKNEYRIRLIDDYETDWFIISEPKITHNAFSKTTDIAAGHISQTLKYKKTDMEFSDDEGNNVGTPTMLLTTILEGTGWTPGDTASAKFYEKDGETLKQRSLIATGENGGAFSLISAMCDLFDAKAIYHGDTKTVDIQPLNPFSEDLADGEVPAEVKAGLNMLEIHYDKNLKGVIRTPNSENMVTVLNTYGSYGDKDTGLGTIQGAKYNEHVFYADGSAEYVLTDVYGGKWYVPCNAASGDKLIWFDLDFTSRMYVLNETQSTTDNVVIYKTYKTPQTNNVAVADDTVTQKENQFTFLTNFTYYEQIGLLTDEMLAELAKFQRDMPAVYEDLIDAANEESEAQTALNKLAYHGNGFLRLDVSNYAEDIHNADGVDVTQGNGYLQLVINKTDEYPDGVMYRSDYLEKETKYFSWHAAKSLKPNGMAVPNTASWLMIIHDTNPKTWQAFYVRNIDQRKHLQDQFDGSQQWVYSDYTYTKGEERPSTLTLFANYSDCGSSPNQTIPPYSPTDKFYLFCTNSMSGSMGVLLSQEEGVLETLESQTKVVTEEHPTIFEDYRKRVNNLPAVSYTEVGAGYGWCCSYDYTGGNNDKLFFAYPNNGDATWHNVYAQDTQPTFEAGAYFYNTKLKTLYHGEQVEDTNHNTVNTWVLWDTVVHERLGRDFGVVIQECLTRKEAYMGLAEKYVYTHTSAVRKRPDNYAITSPYGYYWAFTTDKDINQNDSIWVDTAKAYLYQGSSENDIVSTQVKPFETVIYPKQNEAENLILKQGGINLSTGKDEDDNGKYCTEYLSVFGGVSYSFNFSLHMKDSETYETAWVLFYDSNKAYYGSKSIGQVGYGQTAYVDVSPVSGSDPQSCGINHTTPADAGYIRIMTSDEHATMNVRVADINSFFTSDGSIAKQYHILSPITTQGTNKGLNNLTALFAEMSDDLYLTYVPNKIAAQEEITTRRNELSELLGDMWREGKRQDDSYVDGDQDRLYDDSMDDLKDLGRPDETYDIDFLDLYGSNHDEEFYADSLTDIEWPDIHETDAVHLVDPEIDINMWAYIDTLDKCYDKPWETKLEINTHLTLMAQHSFTDVLSNIADVASTVKAKQQLYDRAKNINLDGTMDTSTLEGTLDTYRHEILSGQSGWRTNAKGQMIFESADGNSAMMLTGNGLCIANSKDAYGEWNWRTAISGQGIVADAITTGYMSAERLWAGSITTNKIAASVGDELDISSNVGLNLYATVDGEKPSGALRTTDSKIEIKAANGSTPAQVNIASGGEINIAAGGALNISASQIHFGLNDTLDSELTQISSDISNASSLANTVNSKIESVIPEYSATATYAVGDLVTYEDPTTYEIKVYKCTTAISTAESWNALHWTVTEMGAEISNKYDIVSGVDIVSNGVEISGSKYVKIKSGGLFTVEGNNFSIGADGSVSMTGSITATGGNIAGFTIRAYDSTVPTPGAIYNGVSALNDTSNNGVYLGTDGLYIRGTNNGVTNYIKATSSGTVDISGTITATAGEIAGLTIGSTTSGNVTTSYMKTGITDMSDTTNNGVYIGTDGLYIRGTNSNNVTGYIKATTDGTVEMSGSLTAGKWAFKKWGIFQANAASNTEAFFLGRYNVQEADTGEILAAPTYHILLNAQHTANEGAPVMYYLQEMAFECGLHEAKQLASVTLANESWTSLSSLGSNVTVWRPNKWGDRAAYEKYANSLSALGNPSHPWTYGYIENIYGNAETATKLKNLCVAEGPQTFVVPSNSYHLLLCYTSDSSTSWFGFVVANNNGAVTARSLISSQGATTNTATANRITVGGMTSNTWVIGLDICMSGSEMTTA